MNSSTLYIGSLSLIFIALISTKPEVVASASIGGLVLMWMGIAARIKP